MPAASKAQQQAAGAALAAKEKGTTKGLKGASKAMVKMSKAELEKIASTKHKGLPKHVKESITMEEPMEEAPINEIQIADNITFWVVEKPTSPTDNPMDLYFETDPLGFANQIMGGLMPGNILGFYTNEDEAANVAHDQVTAVMEAAKALEKKKQDVTGKIEETIKQLQKEVNRCMDEGDDMKAQEALQRIAELRHKQSMVEASKKPLEETENDSKKKVNEGAFDRLKARLKGTGANVSTRFSNLGAYLRGDKDAIKDPALAKNLAILQQKARTLDKALVDVINDVNKLFPEETLAKAPAEFGPVFSEYLDLIDRTRTLNTSIASGNLSDKGSSSNQPATDQEAGGDDQGDKSTTTTPTTQQSTTTTTQAPATKKQLSFDGKKYTVDKSGRVRISIGGKRVSLKPIEYEGNLFIPLVKDDNGKIKQVEKKGDKLYIKDTNTEVVIKGKK